MMYSVLLLLVLIASSLALHYKVPANTNTTLEPIRESFEWDGSFQIRPRPQINFTAACAAPSGVTYGQEFTVNFQVGGRSRSFILFIPASLERDPTEPRPLVLNFHGFTSSARYQMTRSRMNAAASQYRYIAAYPEGTGLIRGFNGAGCCITGVDDVEYTTELVKLISERYACLDSTRLFSSGFSNGGFMSHKLACELPGFFRAIAPMSGVYGRNYGSNCNTPTAIYSMHGTNDGTVSYFGTFTWASFMTVAENYAKLNGCDNLEENGELDRDPVEPPQWECLKGKNCNVPTTFCTLPDFPHSWADGTDRPWGISATNEMFKFFDSL